MQISVQLTDLSDTITRCFIHCFIFPVFFLKNHSVGTLWYFALERKCHRTVTSSSLTTTNNLICNLLALSFQTIYVYKIPPGRGEGFTRWPTEIPQCDFLFFNKALHGYLSGFLKTGLARHSTHSTTRKIKDNGKDRFKSLHLTPGRW